MNSRLSKIFTLSLLSIFIAACTKNASNTNSEKKVLVDGSSTVFPITEAAAEEFQKVNSDTHVTVGISGTGGGFKKFVVGEIDIADASRPIKPEEIEKAKANGIEYIEIPVAYDGITIVVNKENTWADKITVAELKKIWERGSKVKKWKDVRAAWPDEDIKLYGPGTDSGTFDYFTEAINGEAKNSRADFTMSEDDNVLVKGVTGDKYSLGYFGYSYFEANKEHVKDVAVDGGSGPVLPTYETINKNTYKPLSREVFIYVNAKSIREKEHVKNFVKFYLQEVPKLLSQIGFVALPNEAYAKSLALPDLSGVAR
ncbi:MAG: PstS family phosphate ABC transporter substrate-binding protein [Proteobacteria bacterium]|nr:PstS family phosphate ABC transporter substrate-binding protein [Pseudomonadota bacterium]